MTLGPRRAIVTLLVSLGRIRQGASDARCPRFATDASEATRTAVTSYSRRTIGDLQVVLPVARRAGELPLALEVVVGQRGGEALGERGVVAPDAQHAVLKRDAVGAAYAARVEVLHDQAVAVLEGADDADCVRERLMVVARPLNEEVAALEPLEGDAARHNGVKLRVGRLGGPGADQRVERLKGGISLGHVRRTIAPSRHSSLHRTHRPLDRCGTEARPGQRAAVFQTVERRDRLACRVSHCANRDSFPDARAVESAPMQQWGDLLVRRITAAALRHLTWSISNSQTGVHSGS